MKSRILFISGRQEDARRLCQMLHALPLKLDHVLSLQQARTRLDQQEYDVILTEAALPDGKWLDVLHLVRESPRETEVIVTDPQADARFWAEALNLGAYDLLAQPFYEPEVRRILYNACSRPPPRCIPWPPYNGFSTHGETMSAATDAFVQQNQTPPARRAEAVPAHSQHQHPARKSRRCGTRRQLRRRCPAHRRHGERRAHPDRQAPAGLCRLAARSRQAHRSLLRPLRRAARRPAGTVDHPALRTHRARRQPLRPRHRRRQGPDVLPHQGHRGARKPPPARCPSTSASSWRARRRSAALPSRNMSPKTPTSSAPMSRWCPTPRCTRKACRRSASGCAD